MTDELLVQRCLNGDKDAFGFLVDKYKESVYGLAYAKVGNVHDAEDIAQEAFLNAYKNLYQFRHPYKFHSWLYAITANCCKMWHRKRAREHEQTGYLEDVPKAVLADVALKQHRDGEMRQTLTDAILALPDDTRLAMTLYYINDQSCKEIAEFMGISCGNVRVKLHRGRKQLGQELEAMAERKTGKSRVRFGFTFNVMAAIKNLQLQRPKTAPPFVRALPWGTGLLTLLVLGLFLGFGSHLGGGHGAVGNGSVPSDWLEVEMLVENPGLAETTAVDEEGKFIASDSPKMAKFGGERSKSKGGTIMGPSPTARETLQRMNQTLGKIQDIKFTSESTYEKSGSNDISVYEFKTPDKYRIETKNLVVISDGVKRWSYWPESDERFITVSKAVSEGESLGIYLNGLIRFPQTDFSKKYSVQSEGRQKIDGEEVITLRFNEQSSRAAEWLFEPDFLMYVPGEQISTRIGIDPETYLPVFRERPGYTTRITKTQKFGDVVLPVEYESLYESGKIYYRRYKDIELNSGVPDSRFEFTPQKGALVIVENLRAQNLQGLEELVETEPDNVAARYTLLERYCTRYPLRVKAEDLKEHINKLMESAPLLPSALAVAGRAYLRIKEPERAFMAFNKCAQLSPKMWDIHLLLAQTYEDLGRIDEAIEEYKRHLQGVQSKDLATSWYNVGYNNNPSGLLAALCRKHDKLDELIEEYQRRIEVEPENICLHRLLSDAYYEGGDKAKAAEAYRRMFELIQKNRAFSASSLENFFTKRMEELGLQRELAEYYEKVNGDYLTAIAHLYAQLGENDRVVDFYLKSVKQQPWKDRNNMVSRINKALGKIDLIQLLEDYRLKHLEEGAVYQGLGELYSKTDVPRAMEMYERAAELPPESPEPFAALAKLYAEGGRYEEAMKQCQSAVRLRPANLSYQAMLSYAYNRLGRHDEAIEIGLTMNRENRHDFSTYIVLGCVYFNAGKYDDAIAQFQLAVQLSDRYQHKFIRRYLAVVTAKMGRGAIPEMGEYELSELLKMYTEKGEVDTLLQLALKGIRTGREEWQLLNIQNEIGNALADAGFLNEATRAFEAELQHHPKNAGVYTMLAHIYGRQHEWRRSEEMLLKALPLATNIAYQAKIYRKLGDIYRGNYYQEPDKYEKALEAYQNELRLMPDWISTYRNIAKIYAELNQPEEAAKLADEILPKLKSESPPLSEDAEISRKSHIYQTLAEVYTVAGQYEKAIHAYEMVIKLYPNLAEFFQPTINECRKKLGESAD